MSSPRTGLLTPRETPNDESPKPLGATKMAVSPVFRPDAQLDPSCAAPDLAVLSPNSMLFYVHSKNLLDVSKNAFSSLLPPSESREFGLDLPVIRVQVDSTVLDLVLHAIYGLNMAARKPTLDQLSLAVDALLARYAVPPPLVLSPGLPLFDSILAHAPAHPLRVYVLAAHYEADALAVAASAHMLSFPLMMLTDDDARAMGAVYLRRLFRLHIKRVEALRGLLAMSPASHAQECDQQAKVQNAWALATAAIVLDAKPDTSPHALEAAFKPALTDVSCPECRRALEDCIQKLVGGWCAVKGTI